MEKDWLEETKELLITLTQIPAPTGKEKARADFIEIYLLQKGILGRRDTAGNLIYEIKGEKPEYALFTAHLDTVFDDEVIRVEEKPAECASGNNRTGRILCAPGIGDDTSNVVLLIKLLEAMHMRKEKPQQSILIAFDVGEEGLGNLKGIRQLCQDYASQLAEVIAVDLQYHTIYIKAAGSIRLRAEITTEGGHSYKEFGNANAIAEAAELISRIYQIDVSEEAEKVTYNVGKIEGGTSVNTIAADCSFLVEVRSENEQLLQKYIKKVKNIILSAKKAKVTLTEIGNRPCNGAVPADRQRQLIDRAGKAIFEVTGKEAICTGGSTDCNIPLSLGIPAVGFGGYEGGGAHTKQEWMNPDSLETGYRILCKFAEKYYSC